MKETDETSGNELSPQKMRKLGFGLRLVPTILFLIAGIALIVYGVLSASELEANTNNVDSSSEAQALMICKLIGSGILVVGVLLLAMAILGRKHKWANIVYIVPCALYIFSPIGVLGLVGGIFGIKAISAERAAISATAETVQPLSDTSSPEITENTDVVAEEAADDSLAADGISEAAADSSVTEEKRTESKIKEPNKKIGWVIFGIMTALYAVWLVLGIVSAITPSSCILWDAAETEEKTIAMNLTSAILMILCVPSYGYYIALRSPVKTKVKVKIIIIAVCVGLSILGDVLFYLLLSEQLKLVGNIKIALPFAQVGLILVYGLTFVPIPSAALAKKKWIDTGSIWRDIFGKFFYFLANLLKALLRARSTAAFMVIGSFMFTFGAFESLALVITLLSLVVVMFFGMVLYNLYLPSKKPQDCEIWDNGTRLTLKYESRDGYNNADIYIDDHGDRWATKDGGGTFYSMGKD